MSTVYLALGSNLGDRRLYIERAVEELGACGVDVRRMSAVIETKPVGGPVQDNFLNAVLKAETQHSPEDLLIVVAAIEEKLGRKRKVFHGPRTIDIDILLYDDIKLVTRKLIIPHPRMLERTFVMEPLKEIDPGICASFKI